MPFFSIETYNGHEYYSIYSGGTRPTERTLKKGNQKFIEISEQEATLPLLDLIATYKRMNSKPETVEEIAIAAARKAKLLETFIGIIKTSDQEGERNAAKTAYKNLAGYEYKEL